MEEGAGRVKQLELGRTEYSSLGEIFLTTFLSLFHALELCLPHCYRCLCVFGFFFVCVCVMRFFFFFSLVVCWVYMLIAGL